MVEAGCWRSSFPYFCVPRPQAAGQSQTELRDLGPPQSASHCFTCPQAAPYWVTFGRRSSTSYRTWEGSTRLGSGLRWVRVCMCVAGRTRGGKVSSQTSCCNVKEREQEIIMYSKGALQSPIQWHATRAHRSSMLHHIPIHDNWAGRLSICQYIDN